MGPVNGQGLSRRAFLAGTCSVLALTSGAAAARLGTVHELAVLDGVIDAIAGPLAVPALMRTALQSDFAQHFGKPALWALADHFRRIGLASVVDPQPQMIEEQLRWIALYLFTGSADPSKPSAPLTNYPYALSWTSLSFAKAPGLCSGPQFGYWEKPWVAA